MPPTGTGFPPNAILLRSSDVDANAANAAGAAAAAANTNATLPPWLSLEPADPSEWNGGAVIPVAVISAAVATIFVAMRFYTRARLLHAVKWDDWLILLSLLFAIATSGGMIAQLNFGLGEHLYFAWPSFSSYIQAGTLTNLFYSISLTLTKISILLLYIRILTSYDFVRLLGKILLGAVIVSHTWIIVSILTTCIPLSATWDYDPANPPIYCHPISVFWGNACLHLATDFLIFVLPLPVISSMRLPRRQKTGLYFVFCLAFLVCAISIIRLMGFFHTDETPEQMMDVTWTAVRIATWTCVEVHAAIVTACLTTLKPLLCLLFPKLMASATAFPLPDTLATTNTAAAEARRRKDFEDNFSTGEIKGYQRPLTIGTKTNRPKIRRDTFASLVAGGSDKGGSTEHIEVGTPTTATKLTSEKDDGSEFRLGELDTGAPLQWPPSPLLRVWSRLQMPSRESRIRGSTVPGGSVRGLTAQHKRYQSVDRLSVNPSSTPRSSVFQHKRFQSVDRGSSISGSVRGSLAQHKRYQSIDRSSPPPPLPGRRLV